MDIEGLDLVVCAILAILGALLVFGINGAVIGIFGSTVGAYFSYKTLKYKQEETIKQINQRFEIEKRLIQEKERQRKR